MPFAQREWRLLHWRTLPTLRPAEVAAVTGLGIGLVRKLIAKGELPAQHVGAAVLVPVDAVLELVGRPDRAPPPPPRPRTAVQRWAEKQADRAFRRLRGPA